MEPLPLPGEDPPGEKKHVLVASAPDISNLPSSAPKYLLGALYFRIHMTECCLRILGESHTECIALGKPLNPLVRSSLVCPAFVHDVTLEQELVDGEKKLDAKVCIVTFHDASNATVARTSGVVTDAIDWIENSCIDWHQRKIAQKIVQEEEDRERRRNGLFVRGVKKPEDYIKRLLEQSLQLPRYDRNLPAPKGLVYMGNDTLKAKAEESKIEDGKSVELK